MGESLDAFQKNQTNIVSFKSYLYRTVQTTLWDAIRTLDKDSQTESLTDGHPVMAPSDRLHEERLALEGYLKELKPEEVRLIRAHLNGFSTDEIATLMGWSEGRVRNLLSRLKKKLIEMGNPSAEP